MDAAVGEAVDVFFGFLSIGFGEAFKTPTVVVVGFVAAGAGDRLFVTGRDVAIEAVDGAAEAFLELGDVRIVKADGVEVEVDFHVREVGDLQEIDPVVEEPEPGGKVLL